MPWSRSTRFMEETSASLAGIAPTASGEYPAPAHYPVLPSASRRRPHAPRRRRCWSRTRKPRRGERPTPVPAGTREGRPVPEPATVRSGRVVILSSSGSPAAAAWKLPAPAGTTGDDVRGVAEGAEFTGGAETLADRRGLRESVNARRTGRTSSGRPHTARSDLRRAAPVLGVCRCRADHVGHRHVMRYCASSA
jgi:hypothetical protein